MSDLLRSALDDISREAVPPANLAEDVLRLAGRRRARRRALVPVAAVAAFAAVALAVTALAGPLRHGSVTPAAPATGPGSVPSHVSAPRGVVRSIFTAPIWRASLMYQDRHGTPILYSADGDAVRSLPVSNSAGYVGKAFTLSPDGTKVAFGWVADGPGAVARQPSRAQLRIVTLATGKTAVLPLPGHGYGEIVDHLTWSADSAQLLVQAINIEDVVKGGWSGKSDVFVVDAVSADRTKDADFMGAFLGGWSGERLLSVDIPWQISDLAGHVERSISISDMPDAGPHGDITSGDGFNWSPDEKTAAMAVGKALPGHPLNTYDGSSRPFLLRVVSLESTDPTGKAAEIDVPLGSAQSAYLVGWRDADHALVALWSDGGAQRVESVDVRSGKIVPVVSVDAGVSTGAIAIAADIARTGGFR